MTDKEPRITKAEKYKLLVELKELFIEHKNIIIDEKSKIIDYRASLSATKLLKLIYAKESPLKGYFDKKIDEYQDLQKEIEKFNTAISLKREQISLLSKKDFFGAFHDNEVTFWVFQENIFDDFALNAGNGIFSYIEIFLREKLSNRQYAILYNEHKNTLQAFTMFDTDEYNKNLAYLYDFYYLYKYENSFYINNPNMTTFLYIATTKVLRDLIGYVNFLLFSKDKEEEIKKTNLPNRLYFDDYQDLKEFTPSQRITLDLIANGRITNEQIKKERTFTSKSTKSHISEISDIFKTKGIITNRGGIVAIYEALRQHPEWFEPKVMKSK